MGQNKPNMVGDRINLSDSRVGLLSDKEHTVRHHLDTAIRKEVQVAEQLFYTLIYLLIAI